MIQFLWNNKKKTRVGIKATTETGAQNSNHSGAILEKGKAVQIKEPLMI